MRIRSIVFAFMFLCFVFDLSAQTPKIDSLKTLLKSVKSDTNKVIALNTLAWEFLKIGQFSITDSIANSALTLSTKLNYKSGLAKACFNSGAAKYSLGEFPKALEYFKRSLQLNSELRDKVTELRCLGNIGNIQFEQGDYPKALASFLNVITIAEQVDNKPAIANVFGSIGNVYNRLKEWDKALEYYAKSQKAWEELGNVMGVARNLNNSGVILKEKKQTRKALDYYSKAFKISEKAGDKKLTNEVLGNMGNAYQEFGDSANKVNNKDLAKNYFSKAEECYLKVLGISEQIGDKHTMASIYGNLGKLEIHLKKYSSAETNLNKALSLSNELDDLSKIQDWQNYLSDLYQAQNNWKEAFKHYSLFIAARDTIYNALNTKKTVESQMNHEFDKKEALAAKEQEKKDLFAKEEKQKQSIILFSVIAGLLVVLTFSIFLYNRFKLIQKQKKVIEIQKDEVEQQKNLVERKNLEIEEKQKEIIDSITYARRIQRALITNDKYIEKSLNKLNQN